jgi:uncharacterized protein
MEDVPAHVMRTLLGLGVGMGLGFAGRRGRFCTLGAIEDACYADDTRRLRAWLLAIAVSIAGVHALELWSGLDASRSIYAGPRIKWGGAILGGLMFGFGMALAGTCGFGTLLRLGGGDLKALLIFLVMAIVAGMALRGPIGLARIYLLDPLTLSLSPSGSQRLPGILGFAGSTASMLALVLAGALALIALANASFRRSVAMLATGTAIGLLIVLGWWATGIAGFDPFEARRVESFSFVAPLSETLLYFMLSTGVRPDFAVGAVVGVIAGAFVAARASGQFRWEAPDDAREMKRHLFGACLMATGGVAALGCTIGQGITGISTLSVSSFLALASILAGARAGLYWLVERR